jgi:hypothetical protein
VLSYVFKIGKVDMVAEAKWLDEIDTSNRLQGNLVWFKLLAKFQTKSKIGKSDVNQL